MPQDPNALPALLEQALSDPSTELAIRRQLLELAGKNLHLPGVVEALVSALSVVGDADARRCLIQFLLPLESNRFADVPAFHCVLVKVLDSEKERGMRVQLLERLALGLHQDPQLVPVFLRLAGDPRLSEPEKAVVVEALSQLPSLDERTLIVALASNVGAPAQVQAVILSAVETRPSWSDELVAALPPYLESKVDRGLRASLFRALHKAYRLGVEYVSSFCDILRYDGDAEMRAQALELLVKIEPQQRDVYTQLLWTSRMDQEPDLRSRAFELQRDYPDLSIEELRSMAADLFKETSAEIRIAILGTLRAYLRDESVRRALAANFNTASIAQAEKQEFETICDLLLPYVTRDAAIRSTFLDVAEKEPQPSLRSFLLEKLLPLLDIQENLAWICERFSRERNPNIRATLFDRIKALSVARYAPLAEAFCAELLDPASPFRVQSAAALSSLVAKDEATLEAFEDVLRHDRDRELIRVCTDGYLDSGAAVKFDVLIGIAGDEAFDLRSRKRALAKLHDMALDDDEQRRLDGLRSSGLEDELKGPK
jgi:hypothetical protein